MDLSLLVKQEMVAKTNAVTHVISASHIHYNTHTEVHTHTHTLFDFCLFVFLR